MSDHNVTAIAFYLPQFYPTKTNDRLWGNGFTEWTNVSAARPRFEGHYQPKIPGELGFYDLRLTSVLRDQISLANAHSIYGFCFYYYRFGSERELDVPVRNLLQSSGPMVPFCLCWANESWTRAWDGKSNDVTRAQDYGSTTLDGVVNDFCNAMSDLRYIKIDGRPLLLIYQIDKLIAEGGGESVNIVMAALSHRLGVRPLLAAVFSPNMNTEIAALADIVVQFPPHRLPRLSKRKLMDKKDLPISDDRDDFFERYDDVVSASLEGLDWVPNLVPGVCPDWDNSARRAQNAHIIIGSTPAKFQSWVESAASAAMEKFRRGAIPHPLLFVNAWNEWAEGAAMEPSWKLGRLYLEAFRAGLHAATDGRLKH